MGIHFRNVEHEYKTITNKYKAIKDINVSIDEENEFVAICGKTGSGKSTFIEHMNALLIPTKGTIEIFENILPSKKKIKINPIRKNVGLVFQFPEYQLFEETVLKDVSFAPKNFKEKNYEELAMDAITKVGLNLDLIDKSPFQISGGEMRRVAIAGILAMQPKILILDEPTRGLDPKGRIEIMELFKSIHEKDKKSIVFISHDMDIVSKYAKRVVVLDEGMIVFDGKKEDLFIHENFDKFHLDLPYSIKMINYLSSKHNKKYEYKYDYESLLTYLKEQNLNE